MIGQELDVSPDAKTGHARIKSPQLASICSSKTPHPSIYLAFGMKLSKITAITSKAS
jgi:hypothetical protein